ncbi:AAA family ATPase [Mollicutes bacterium LVI A0078]|nr:AAA family ATPase [Mollicutes bacterium LVI A0075]WOO91439.1 AAA family ATPase [Mollicutes bacterium LVI A0078]
MRINKLTIENFRSYEHKTEFTFKGENDINVILGQNGTGKTSFLSAIKYVLFGPRTFGSDFFTKDYINWANREVNFNSKNNTFEVGLQFIYNDQLIDVVRTSTVGKKYSENIIVFISGQKQKDAKFLDNFNYNLFNNIFFNGENISLLTSSDKELKQFVETIVDVYFELDVFKLIKKDTENAINRSLKEVATSEYKVLEKKLVRNDMKLKDYSTSMARIVNEIEANNVKIDQLEQEMEKRHALSTRDEKRIQGNVDNAKSEYSLSEKKLVNFLKTDAHKLLMNSVLKKSNEKIKQSRKSRIEILRNVYSAIENDQYVDLDTVDILNLKTEVRIANSILDYDKKEILSEIENYNRIVRSLKINQTKLSKSEDGKKMMNFNTNYEFLVKHGEDLNKQYERIETKHNLKLAERNDILNMIEVEKKKMLDDELLNNAIREKNNLIEICERYLSEQSNTVFHQVAGSMEQFLKHHLLRKSNLIDSISIVDYNLQIVKDGKIRPIDSFSAGEQQLLLIALIFAVLKQARVEVPLILDTFFARIDDVQQDNLINFLCSQLNNQILFIATDSELPADKLEKFNNINKIYKLENDGYKTKVGVIDEN